MATTTAIQTATATTVAQQRPLRGISIIIEAEPKPTAVNTNHNNNNNNNRNNNNNSNIESDEMSLKSQRMLLAFGDKHGSNLQTLQVDHATKVDLETSCNIDTATEAATTKLYPQLLLRIGQSEEAETRATAATSAAEAEVEAATTATIISCNVSDDDEDNDVDNDNVRNVLLAAATVDVAAASAAGEIIAESVASQLVDWTTATSALTDAQQQQQHQQHTVKIQIANSNGQSSPTATTLTPATVAGQCQQRRLGKQISVVKLNDSQSSNHSSEMVLQLKHQQQQQQQLQQHQQQQQQQQPYQLCYLVSSGQYSPCETLDSGTGSDLESIKSPDSSCSSSHSSNHSSHSNGGPLQLHLKTTRIRVNNASATATTTTTATSATTTTSGMQHSRAYSLTDDSEECDESSSSSLSCDSLHSNDANIGLRPHKLVAAQLLPSSLLHDIRNTERDAITAKAATTTATLTPSTATKIDGRPLQFEADQYYNFHVHEHDNYRSFGDYATQLQQQHQQLLPEEQQLDEDEDAFVGYKDVRRASQASTIRSSKGTVRGVKNRVRNGVATFLQLQQPNAKNYKEKDVGKVVLYTTSMGIIRDTYGKCANVKQILRTLLIKFEERDVFMSLEYQQEMRDRMQHETIRVPQLFVEGQHIGDADTVERLNESGELRQLLRPYKSLATAYTCQTCGGYRLLPCPSCNGSKKSVHRNHFTAEFVALKCMNCDEVGLVKCPNC
ncbi:glutaredoxin domain-containing cysteine-rich protein CG12206 [Drosophila nasuta]|uniref:glutaredoxin domain-containing cysteine-rich protein CG12206 n=1 Tax=Drosophila nasuta TaxID=42062 RepID=UPI00295F4E61|nr:glutaredoxin domain-containing cysteine-rich protein CG12206 [Drosophila nasuta]